MGQKNSKGTVTITNADGRIRLRWRYQNKRASVNLSSYSKTNLLHAKKIALQIEQDIIPENYYYTLLRYAGNKTPSKCANTIFHYKQLDSIEQT